MTHLKTFDLMKIQRYNFITLTKGDTKMTADEVYQAITESNKNECYQIILLINNDKMEEAADDIQALFPCDREAAMDVARRFELRLREKN